MGAKVINASVGPTVTRFELKPEIGVRVSKIEGLSNELAMALAATHIRIEAPIPGKSAVGIECQTAKLFLYLSGMFLQVMNSKREGTYSGCLREGYHGKTSCY